MGDWGTEEKHGRSGRRKRRWLGLWEGRAEEGRKEEGDKEAVTGGEGRRECTW